LSLNGYTFSDNTKIFVKFAENDYSYNKKNNIKPKTNNSINSPKSPTTTFNRLNFNLLNRKPSISNLQNVELSNKKSANLNSSTIRHMQTSPVSISQAINSFNLNINNLSSNSLTSISQGIPTTTWIPVTNVMVNPQQYNYPTSPVYSIITPSRPVQTSVLLKVMNLPIYNNISLLYNLFSNYGRVNNINFESQSLYNIVAYVEMANERDALNAINSLRGKILQGSNSPLEIFFV